MLRLGEPTFPTPYPPPPQKKTHPKNKQTTNHTHTKPHKETAILRNTTSLSYTFKLQTLHFPQTPWATLVAILVSLITVKPIAGFPVRVCRACLTWPSTRGLTLRVLLTLQDVAHHLQKEIKSYVHCMRGESVVPDLSLEPLPVFRAPLSTSFLSVQIIILREGAWFVCGCVCVWGGGGLFVCVVCVCVLFPYM